jgi:hypothetical protein
VEGRIQIIKIIIVLKAFAAGIFVGKDIIKFMEFVFGKKGTVIF